MAKDYIKNEAGHTEYPKYVDHPTEKDNLGYPKPVIVNTPEDEASLLGKGSAKSKVWPDDKSK